MLKIILTTGGTGGHVFPALAVAEALKARNPGADLLFVGGLYGREAEWAASAGIEFIGLPGRGMLGKGIRAVPAVWDNLKAIAMAVKVVRDFSPCAVAAFGGYAAFPAAMAARLLGIPLLMHEQNAIAGMVSRIIGRLAATRCASIKDTGGLPRPYVVTGNPVRGQIRRVKVKQKGERRHLFVLGGSQGAHGLNEFMFANAPLFAREGIGILHQTGMKDLEKARDIYRQACLDPLCAQPFIEDMASAYEWADLALCRAGASTVAELGVTGTPAFFVPFPAAIHDHQTLNARAMQSAGAALIRQEKDLRGAESEIVDLLKSPRRLVEMAEKAAALQQGNAADLVALEIGKLCLIS